MSAPLIDLLGTDTIERVLAKARIALATFVGDEANRALAAPPDVPPDAPPDARSTRAAGSSRWP